MTELRVGIPASRLHADTTFGAGRVWMTVLEILRGRGVSIEPRHPGWRSRIRTLQGAAPDVWLVPGDVGRFSVQEPVVALVHGAAWPIEEAFHDHVPRESAESLIAAVEATLAVTSVAIVPSSYTRRGLVEGYGMDPDSVFVVAHGVDAATFRPDREGGREMVAAELGRAAPYVLFASIPSIPQKNLRALREALGVLAAGGRPHALVIAGGLAGGESADELAAITADIPGTSGRVAWLGHLDDESLAALMAGCDAFCLPSLFESFGLTALEAMAVGAPVVVSDRGALPEVVRDAAIVTDPSPAALAAALGRVLDDPALAARLRTAGRARAETMTWERTANGWLAALRHAAAR